MSLISNLSFKRMVTIGKGTFRVLQLTLIRENTIASPCIASWDLYMKISKIVLKNLKCVVANTAVIWWYCVLKSEWNKATRILTYVLPGKIHVNVKFEFVIFNREEKSLRHVAMVAKFLDLNKQICKYTTEKKTRINLDFWETAYIPLP